MKTLTVHELEQVYDALALAIDQVTPAQSERFLVKLALLAAHALGDGRKFVELVESAQQDL